MKTYFYKSGYLLFFLFISLNTYSKNILLEDESPYKEKAEKVIKDFFSTIEGYRIFEEKRNEYLYKIKKNYIAGDALDKKNFDREFYSSSPNTQIYTYYTIDDFLKDISIFFDSRKDMLFSINGFIFWPVQVTNNAYILRVYCYRTLNDKTHPIEVLCRFDLGNILDCKIIGIKCLGHQTLSNGKYIGEMKDGKRHGIGCYVWEDSSYYMGDWIDDLRTGKGTCFFSDKTFRRSNYMNGKLHGYSIYADQSVKIEYWENNDRKNYKDFVTSCSYPNGDYYTGGYKNGKKEGLGYYFLRGGDFFEVEWEDDRPKTEGIYHYIKNGMVVKRELKKPDNFNNGIITNSTSVQRTNSQPVKVNHSVSKKVNFWEQMEIGFNFYGGVDFPRFYNDENRINSILGWQIGAGAVYHPVIDYFKYFPISFSTGAGLVLNRFTTENDYVEGQSFLSLSFNIPTDLLFSFKQIYFKIGMDHNLNIFTAVKYDNMEAIFPSTTETLFFNSHQNFYTADADLGLGYRFDTSAGYNNVESLLLSVNYKHSLTNRINTSYKRRINNIDIYPFEKLNLKNQSITLNFTLFF